MPALSRRAFLATGTAGAAGVGLAACGAEAEESNRDPNEDRNLLAPIGSAEAELTEAAQSAAGSDLPRAQRDLVAAVADASTARIEAIDRLIDNVTIDIPQGKPGGGSLDDVAVAASHAISLYREAAALLSTEELRAAVLENGAPVAAELAATRSLLGEDPSPFAFVTGLEEKPYEAVESDSEETTGSETETTTTGPTTTTAEGEG